MMFNAPPEKYSLNPTFKIPDTVNAIKLTAAAVVPHFEMNPHNLSNAISNAVFGASSVCIFIRVSPLTVLVPTSVTIILPSPDTTVVPANRQFGFI